MSYQWSYRHRIWRLPKTKQKVKRHFPRKSNNLLFLVLVGGSDLILFLIIQQPVLPFCINQISCRSRKVKPFYQIVLSILITKIVTCLDLNLVTIVNKRALKFVHSIEKGYEVKKNKHFTNTDIIMDRLTYLFNTIVTLWYVVISPSLILSFKIQYM